MACRLLAIDRDEFLAAATGSPAARAASERLVAKRLAAGAASRPPGSPDVLLDREDLDRANVGITGE
jgi:hypothetical protein